MCEGYRNKIDLLFRNQTEDVAVRAQGGKLNQKSISGIPRKHPSPLAVQISTGSERAGSSTSSRPQCLLPKTLWLRVEDQATCFFFSKYGTRQRSEQRLNLYEYLPELYNLDTKNGSLHCIITAIGLAGLSHHSNNPELLLASTASYNLALSHTNHALRQLMTASSDQTLISILLLGLYEASVFLFLCRVRLS